MSHDVTTIKIQIGKKITSLAKRREELSEQLRLLTAMYTVADGKKRVVRRKVLGKKAIAQEAKRLLSRGEVTANSLGQRTGQSAKNATQTLARLTRSGEARRIKTGVYGSKR